MKHKITLLITIFILHPIIHNPCYSYSSANYNEVSFDIDTTMPFLPDDDMMNYNRDVVNSVVGAIGGTVNVSALGGAVYSIPIEVLPGKDGMQPSLNVTYNSQTGNGLLGYGWNLTGISAITRCDRTIYHDNNPIIGNSYTVGDGVNFVDDRFMLDGQRLLSVSSNIPYGQTNCLYRTEVDNISKIISLGGDGQNPEKIKVWTKDGLIMEYGYTANSQLIYRNDTVAMWMVNRISDYNGNYMTYTYDNTNNHCRIDYIDYTGCGNVQPIYRVKFNYINRNDIEYHYLYNQKIVSDVLLESISVKYNSAEVYKYTFTYDDINPTNGRFYSRLMSIGLEQNNEKLNPTTIEWGDLESYCDSTNYAYSSFKDICYVGDYNGDGIDDVVTFPYISQNDDYWTCLYGNGDGTFFSINTSLHYNKIDGRNIISVRPCDLNGDGLCDLLFETREINYYWNNTTYYNIFLYYYIANSNGIGFTKSLSSFTYNTSNKSFDHIQVGDFTGNGKNDILVIKEGQRPGNNYGIYASLLSYDLDIDSIYNIYNGWNYIRGNCDDVICGDYNGDGKLEVILTDGYESTQYSVNNNNLTPILSRGFPTAWHTCFPGDFNGDGKTDILSWVTDNTLGPRWEISISTAEGFPSQWIVESSQSFPTLKPSRNGPSLEVPTDNDVSYSVNICDMDGDGKSDIVFVFNNYAKIYHSPVCRYTWFINSCYFIRSNTIQNNPTNNYAYGQNRIGYNHIGKFKNEASCSLLLRYDDYHQKPYLLESYDNQHKQNLVKSITDGLGNTVSFNYDYFTNPEFYTISSGSRFVNINNRVRKQMIPLKALRSMTTRNVSGAKITTEYSYEDMYYHMIGRGIIGFKKTIVNDSTNGIKTVNINRYAGSNRIALPFLVPRSSTTYLVEGNTEKRIKEILNSCVLMGGHSILNKKPPVSIQTNSTRIKNFDINGNPISMLMVDYLYDNSYDGQFYGYSNVKNIMKGYSTDMTCNAIQACPFWEKREITYNNKTDGEWWLVTRVDTNISTNYRGNSGILIDSTKKSTYYQYDPNHPHLLGSEQINPNDNANSELVVKTEFKYTTSDGIISAITKKVSAPNDATVNVRTTTFDYSSQYQYRFPTTITNSLMHSTTATYDQKFGWKLSDTDCNGLTDTFTHDFFGIDSESVSPDGIITHTSKRWATDHADAPGNASYYICTQKSGSYPSTTFYHKTGLPLRHASRSIDGNVVYIDLSYDTKGNLYSESLPYEAGDLPEGYTYYHYDRLNRLIMTEYPDGTSDEVNYHGNEITYTHHDSSNISSQSLMKKYHPNGWLEETTDSGGNTVKYEYNSDGTLKSTYVDGFGAAVTLTYNEAGMRDTINDPDYGRMVYSYNAFGELVYQKTPKNVETAYEYDVLGRMTLRTMSVPREPDETTIWKYSSTTGHLGTLEKIIYNSGAQIITYDYDNLQRVVSSSETYDNTTYSTSYTYDQLGRVNSETYPSGFTVYNRYNTGGYLTAITDSNDNILWQANEHDIFGHLAEFQTGNGIITYRDYDSENGRLLGIITSNNRNIFQNYTYTYDDFGNFASRNKNVGTMLSENFTYDNFNRLTGIQTNGVSYSMSYDRYGRMESKSQHDFSFDNARFSADHPHAVSRVQAHRQPPFGGHTVIYTPFDKVKTIVQNTDSILIEYGYDRQRIRMTETVGGHERVKTYIGNCEFVHSYYEGDYNLTYLYSPDGIFAVAKSTNHGFQLHYVHTDNLGSWDIITNSSGNLEQSLSFDAWGNRRDASTWNGPANDTPMFDRGFTGHEHLYNFGLINMNGRVYDPYMSTFLSPDNYIQCPDNSQNFNKYAYCLNNPLKYTDPSGELFALDDILIAAAVGAVINVTMNGINNSMSGQDFFNGAGKAAIVGGLAGAAGAGVAAAGAGGALVGLAGGAVAGGTNAVLNNTNFGLGVVMGAVSGWVGGGISMYVGGGLGACLGGMAANAVAQIPAIKNGQDFNFSQMLLSGAFSWGAYFGSSYVNWKWRGGNKMGNLDVSFKQFNKMQTLFQRSRAWEKEMGGYLMEDGSFKTAEPGTNSQIDLGPRPDGAIAEFHTHWDKPGKTIYFDNDGNYVKNPPYWKSTVSRYHGALDFTEGIESIVFNRYDGSYFSGEYMLENLPGSFIGPPRWVPTPYQVINPPILRYNYGFLFSIRY